MAEVQTRSQKALIALARLGDTNAREATVPQSQQAVIRIEASPLQEREEDRLRTISCAITQLNK